MKENEGHKSKKIMWIYKRILDPIIDNIYREKLPCPVRQNDYKYLIPDCEIPNWNESKPPEPTWLNKVVYNDVENSNNNDNSDNTNNKPPEKIKVLIDAWIGDALMIYDFLFRFRRLLKMNDTFTISEWIDCIRRKHETYLMNFVLSIFVAVIMDKSELKTKDKHELINGYKCSLLTWPSLLLDWLNIRKRSMLVEERSKHYAFNDVINTIHRNKPDMDNGLSTPFFSEISCERKIELLKLLMNHIVGETKLFKHQFQKTTHQMDKYRQNYLQKRDEECKRCRADAKNEDKVMRGLHRSIPVHWTDFDIICKADARGEMMNDDFMEQFYAKFFHSMSLEGANKGKVTKEEIQRYKTKLKVLIELKNQLSDAGELIDCKQPTNLSKTDPKTKLIKEKWRGKVQQNVEKIFKKYINDFVIEPETKIFNENRKEILRVMVEDYNQTSALSLGYDRYGMRYWILADDFTKIIVENVDENQWGYYDDDRQLNALIEFLNDKGRNEATLKINLLEKGINYRIDNSIDIQWTLTKWNCDNRNSQWICYPNWRYVLRYQIQQTHFYQYISKNRNKNTAYQQIMLNRNNIINVGNNGGNKYNNDNVPFQVSVIKHFLLDLQWALHIGCSDESLKARELFRENLSNEFININKLAEYVWKLFRSIDILWRKRWLNVKALRKKLMRNDTDAPRTYSTIMLCLYVIDAAVFYSENEYLKQNKNSNKRKHKLRDRMEKLQNDYNNNIEIKHNESQLLKAINLTTKAEPRKRGRKPNSLNKTKTANTPTPLKRERSASTLSYTNNNTNNKIIKKETSVSITPIKSEKYSQNPKLKLKKKILNDSSDSSTDSSKSDSESSKSDSDSESDNSSTSSSESEREIIKEPPRKKAKRGRPRKNPIVNNNKENSPNNKKRTKRYTGVRTSLTLICVKCVKGEDQDAIIKCSSCHSGYHTYCMDIETSWDPKKNDGEFFCHECIGAQISHLSTRRSSRLQHKSPTKSISPIKISNMKNKQQATSSDGDTQSESSDSGKITRKRKRKNKRFEDTSSSEDDSNDILDEPTTKKKKKKK
eukprot:251612_1